jgi:hypothetical protein
VPQNLGRYFFGVAHQQRPQWACAFVRNP